MKKGICSRCSAETPTWEFEKEKTFVGFLKVATEVKRRHTINNRYNYIRGHGAGTLVNFGDEDYTLCEDCWSDFVGYFMQNRIKEQL